MQMWTKCPAKIFDAECILLGNNVRVALDKAL